MSRIYNRSMSLLRIVVEIISSSSCKHLAILRQQSSSSLRNHSLDVLTNISFKLSSKYIPDVHISCNTTLALIVNGAINPKGSNNVAILLRKFRLVNLKLTSGGLALNVNMSLSACHHTPNVFTDGKLRSSICTSDALSSSGILCNTTREFESHLRACMPVFPNNCDN